MKASIFILALVFALVFFIFTYNSGYGYDAIEYLVVGRSLLDGYSVFAFSPSKSPGIFYVVAAFLKLFPDADHLEISALVTVLLLIILAATYMVVRVSHGVRAAFLSSALVAMSAMFMEMNFLETEGFVFLLALPALPSLRNGLRTGSPLWFFAAGLLIGAGAFFKSVALFYLIGAAGFVILWQYRRGSKTRSVILNSLVALGAGAAVAVFAPALYYARHGETWFYFYWSYVFPFLHYGRDTLYLGKLLVKLSWFWLVLAISLLLALHPRVRAAFSMSVYPTASLMLGLAALLPLLKNQASHYVFPAAGFLSIFIGMTYTAFAEIYPRGRRSLSVLLIFGILMAGVSIALYRPSALRRLGTLRDYTQETELARRLQILVPEGRTMLCMSHPLPYWLARRYPAIPTVNLHVHFAHRLRQNPRLLTEALADPNLALVEFDPHWNPIRAPSIKNAPQTQVMLDDFAAALNQHFAPLQIEGAPFLFWTRR